MAHKTLAIIAVLSLAGILFLVYLALTFETPEGTRSMDIAQPVPRPMEPLRPVERPDTAEQTTPQPDDAVPGPFLEPIPEPESVEEVAIEPIEELPALGDSDSLVMSRLASMELGATLLRLVTPEEIIRRFVTFTDNVARNDLPQLDYPLRPPEQSMPVRALDDNLYEMDEGAHERFDRLIDTLVSLDVQQAMAVYRALRPLMQEAYAELGYPDGDFDAVAVQAIDAVLEAPAPEGPYQLIDPGVMYEFAESEVENLSPLSKQLIRIGPENTERLRERLREYRDRLILL